MLPLADVGAPSLAPLPLPDPTGRPWHPTVSAHGIAGGVGPPTVAGLTPPEEMRG